MNFFKIIISAFCVVIPIPIFTQTIHIFGDSHASFCFREGPSLQALETFELRVACKNKSIPLPVTIHWLGPITMHRVGRDGLQFLNVKNYGVKENDIAIFVFGEIDVRCHIGKQRDLKKRDIVEIIGRLVENYLATINANKKMFEHLTCIVCCIIPPIDGALRANPEYPFYGSLRERVEIAKLLNKTLAKKCSIQELLFLDFYDLFTKADGSLSEKYADPTVHINYIYNWLIKRKLIELLEKTLIHYSGLG